MVVILKHPFSLSPAFRLFVISRATSSRNLQIRDSSSTSLTARFLNSRLNFCRASATFLEFKSRFWAQFDFGGCWPVAPSYLKMDRSRLVRISGLLRGRRGISGAFSLLSNVHSSTPNIRQSIADAGIHASRSRPNSRVLRSLVEPCLITGTLNLPVFSDESSPPNSSCHHNCFSFFDGSASVCCDVLDFHICMVGKEIRVLAWNFIPLNKHGGLLEIVKWEFSRDSSCSAVPSMGEMDSISLGFGSTEDNGDTAKARHNLIGLLASISPLTAVPCTSGHEKNGSYATCGVKKKLRGFIVQILTCSCHSCGCSDSIPVPCDFSEQRDGDVHCFTQSKFVYFLGSTSSWHPAMSKLVGKVILLSRLRKKMIFMGQKEKEIMFIPINESSLNLPQLKNKTLSFGCSVIKSRRKFGVYTGVVRDVHLRGMVLELDGNVWLLLTDQLLTPSHSIREGATITVKNVHFVHTQFHCSKTLLLGACYKTSISVASFSPMETRGLVISQSQSLLRKYINSLVFSARLWVLLLVQSFRKKFSGELPEMEILGSMHNEGLAQKYACSMLSSSTIFSPEVEQQRVHLMFCNQNVCGCDTQLNCDIPNMVVPFSIVVQNCEQIWIRSLLQQTYNVHMKEANGQVYHIAKVQTSLVQTQALRIPSENIGLPLLGYIRVSLTTGRLQFTDATYSIDIVIPDLPSAWNIDAVYEVTDYTTVVEGDPESVIQMQMLGNAACSCRSIFDLKPLNDTCLRTYMFFPWRNAKSRPMFIAPCLSSTDNRLELQTGIFHLLFITHIFPMRPTLRIPEHASEVIRPGLFAEAIILPWDLHFVRDDDGAVLASKSTKTKREDLHRDGFQNKRCKLNVTLHMSQKAEFCIDMHSSYDKSSAFSQKSAVDLKMTSMIENKLPCLVTARNAQGETKLGSGALCCFRNSMDFHVGQTFSRKVLLEFSSENVLKYKLLRINAHYMVRHCTEESFCDVKLVNHSRKVVMKPDMHMWSLSFSSNKDVSDPEPLGSQSTSRCLANNATPVNIAHPDDLLPNSLINNNNNECSSDVNLFLSSDGLKLLDLNFRNMEIGEINPPAGPHEILTSRRGSLGTVLNEDKCSDTSSSRFLMPEGNLVSVRGIVAMLHGFENGNLMKYHMRFYEDDEDPICIHILTGDDIVKVTGRLRQNNFPVGLSSGANASFHRVLAAGEPNHFMLLPVSFITVNSVCELKSNEKNGAVLLSSSTPLLRPAPLDCYPYLVSDLIQCSENDSRTFRGKVLAVHTVILSSNCRKHKLLASNQCGEDFNIPLTGLIIDDGSFYSCCWTNGDVAASVLGLHEKMLQVPYENASKYKYKGNDKASVIPSNYLNKSLDKYGTITVKNYGSLLDTLGQDLQIHAGTNCVITPSDEEMIKFIMLDACSGPLQNVSGYKMESNAVRELEKYLSVDELALNSMPHVWVTRASKVNPLGAARAMFEKLTML